MDYSIHQCKFGKVLIASLLGQLCGVEFGKDEDSMLLNLANRHFKGTIFANVIRQELVDRVLLAVNDNIDDDIPFLLMSGTQFQRSVWYALKTIPQGETISYKKLAELVGAPKAYRAVGTACSANPIAIIIPCHRAVHSDGSISGYRWGNDIKLQLLERERL